jgi:hypothetical protein
METQNHEVHAILIRFISTGIALVIAFSRFWEHIISFSSSLESYTCSFEAHCVYHIGSAVWRGFTLRI